MTQGEFNKEIEKSIHATSVYGGVQWAIRLCVLHPYLAKTWWNNAPNYIQCCVGTAFYAEKLYTDLEQSKKLAEILPLESADMYWSRCTITDFGDNILKVSYSVEPCNFSQFKNTDADISCWSLAALLSVLPEIQGSKPVIALDDNYITYPHMSDLHTKADNLVDACYEMILKLKESNLL